MELEEEKLSPEEVLKLPVLLMKNACKYRTSCYKTGEVTKLKVLIKLKGSSTCTFRNLSNFHQSFNVIFSFVGFKIFFFSSLCKRISNVFC